MNLRSAIISFFIVILSALSMTADRLGIVRELSTPGLLRDMTVRQIMKDQTGYVWFGTSKGLERFDGLHVVHFTLPKEGFVSDIAEQKSTGDIYASTADGVWILKHGTPNFVKVDDIKLANVNTMAFAGKSKLIIGTVKGLFIYDTVSKKLSEIQLNKNRSLGNIAVNDILYDRVLGRIWAAASNGLYMSELGYSSFVRFFPYNISGSNSPFNHIVLEGDNLFLSTPDNSIVRFDMTDNRFSPLIDLGYNQIRALVADGKGFLYTGLDGGGVAKLDAASGEIVSRFTHNPKETGNLHSNSVYSLMVDEGQLWIGFYQTGVDYTMNSNGIFSLFDEDYYSSLGIPARTMLLDGDRIVLGTLSGLVVIDRKEKNTRFVKEPELKSTMVISCIKHDGFYFIGTYGGGLSVLDPETLKPVNYTEYDHNLDKSHVFSYTKDSAGNLWIGTSEGLFRLDTERNLTQFTSNNSRLPEGNVFEVFFDSKGKGWIATASGMAIYDPLTATIRTDVFPTGFFNKADIRQIYEGKNGKMYFLPDKGNYYVSDLNMSRFSEGEESFLKGFDSKAIFEDKDGDVWLAGSDGIFRIKSSGSWEQYDAADGVPNPIFTSLHPKMQADGSIWFGNTKGLVKLDPQKKNFSRVAKMRINRVSDDGKTLYPEIRYEKDSIITIKFERYLSDVSISLSAFNYSNPDMIHYEYHIEGKDDEWKECPPDLDITIFNLKQGKTKIHVRRIGDHKDSILIILDNPLNSLILALILFAFAAVCAITAFFILHRRRKNSLSQQEEYYNEEVSGDSEAAEEGSENDTDANRKYKVMKFDEKECEKIDRLLVQIEKKERPFTRSDLRIGDLAEMVGISSFKLSYYFSQYRHTTYYEYINRLRIDEFKRLANSLDPNRYTLSAMSEMAGFSSRTSFFRYFKKIEGISPAEYIKNLKQ